MDVNPQNRVFDMFTDGRHQSVPDGDLLLFHWSELSAALPPSAEGQNRSLLLQLLLY